VENFVVEIGDPVNYNKKDWPSDGIMIFSDEWATRRHQCENFLQSKRKSINRRVFARKCEVKTVDKETGKRFMDEHHIQGSNKLSLVFFGLFLGQELLSVMSLGRHSRQTSENKIVLDRFCVKSGTHVAGGASRLFKRCIAWASAQKYDQIISFSDNRWTRGEVYETLGFHVEKNHKPDYCYVSVADPTRRLSKQSQKKSNTKCPAGVTELEWSRRNRLERLWDRGKKRWAFELMEGAETAKESLSRRCASQHSSGVFRHSHLRGYFAHEKFPAPVYYASSYELRCLWVLVEDDAVASVCRPEPFKDEAGQWRSADFQVTYQSGTTRIIEVKPAKRLQVEELVQLQVEMSKKFCEIHGFEFQVWTEADSGLGDEKSIIKWAKSHLDSLNGNTALDDRRKEINRKKAKKHYDRSIKKDVVVVQCNFCGTTHELLKLTYERNVKKNGRHICLRENGAIIGSKKKLKKSTLVEGDLGLGTIT
jgi:hypothetical protein